MTLPRGYSFRRSAFTLVELLTVIGIIALLIGILVPSLARARDIAKRTKSLAQVGAIEKSLEIFQNEYNDYPESNSRRLDPISGLPGAVAGNPRLMGAHWLARAMAGPDLQGLDSAGHFLKDRDQTDVVGGKIVSVQSGGGGIPFAAAAAADRKGSYIEDGKLLVKDTDPKLAQINAPGTGRLLIIDSFNWPIIYYKANRRARPHSFSNTGPGASDPLGIYNQNDNIGITGGQGTGAANWDFAATGGLEHGLGYFGPSQANLLSSPNSIEDPSPTNYKGKSFADYLHEHQTHETGGVIKPVKPESFVLISPGKDGIYGTDDDANNFDR